MSARSASMKNGEFVKEGTTLVKMYEMTEHSLREVLDSDLKMNKVVVEGVMVVGSWTLNGQRGKTRFLSYINLQLGIFNMVNLYSEHR